MSHSAYLSNIPNDKTVQELSQEFKRIWPTVFFDNNNIRVNHYPRINQSGQLITSVVVHGINVESAQLIDMSHNDAIFGNRIIIRPDAGEQRHPDGSFVNPKRGSEVRRDLERLGSTQKKVAGVFNSGFLSSIGYYPLRLSDRIVSVRPVHITRGLLSRAGEYRQCWNEQGQANLKLQYTKVIGAMQSVSSLNNKSLGNQKIQFFNDKGFLPTCDRLKGIGRSGILNYDDAVENYGYIRFMDFDPAILDWRKIQRGISSNCWRCEKSYRFLGVEPNLNYLTGICQCNYDGIITEDKKQAYQWATDRGFTRLMVEGIQQGARQLNAVAILHEPMQYSYSSPQHYARIVLPILQEEWCYTSLQFQEAYRTTGRISNSEFIETIDVNRKMRNIFAIEVIVNQSSIWVLTTKEAVKKLTILMTCVHEDRDHTEDYSGRLYQIKPVGEKELCLCIRLFLPVDTSPSKKNIMVEVKPKPDKSEYKTTTSLIQKWSKTEAGDAIQMDDGFKIDVDQPFLKSLMAQVGTNCYLPQYPLTSETHLVMSNINARLNVSQLRAKKKALTHSMSYIHGPPGTGKTEVAAAIVLSLTVREPGLIVVTAASNEACNCLADRIWSMSQELGINPSVVRVMAPSREEWTRDTNVSHNHNYPLLHELVKKYEGFYSENLQKAMDLLSGQMEHSMTELDRKSLDFHIDSIEQQILREYKVAVCTIGSIPDRRVVSSSIGRGVSTLLIEEAGHMTQPQTLPIVLLKPRRIVVIGDHQQLPPTVTSPSAKRAGLADSPLLLASINYGKTEDILIGSNFGWTTLIEQHRMSKPIQELVSAMSYRGLLTEAPSIKTRHPEISKKNLRFFPDLRDHSILLYDERGFETKVGTSYMNTHEAILVAGTVTRLLKGGTPPEKITLLSFYEAQKKEIKKQIEIEQFRHPDITGYLEVRVANVDAYQGRENSLVIVSFVRSNEGGDIGFAREPNRINVALSRARTHLIIVCNLQMFKDFKSQVWTIFVDKVQTLANIM